MRIHSFFFVIILIQCYYVLSFEKESDTIIFTSEKVGLHIFTQNTDSIKFFPEESSYPNPFGPSMLTFAVKISNYDTTKLVIRILDYNKNVMVEFIWNKILPGAYRFDWWNFIKLPSGIYYAEKIINDKSEIKKVILVK